MEAIDGKPYGQGEGPGMFEEGRKEKLPVVAPSFFFYPQEPQGFNEYPDMLELNLGGSAPLLRFIFFEEYPDSFVELLGRINSIQNMLIAVYKRFGVHFRDEVHGVVGIVTRHILK
jgi:hypothetical protein